MNPIKSFPLSNPQRRIWLTETLNNRVDMSNIGYLIEFKERYDLDRLARAVKHVFKANPGLQLRFQYSDEIKGELVQYIAEYQEVDVRIIEVETEDQLVEKIQAMHREQFDLLAPHHCFFAVFSIANTRFGVFEKAHHLVADGISAIIVIQEIIQAYHTPDHPETEETPKPYSYVDFLKDETDYIDSEKYLRDKEYWLGHFNDFEAEALNFALNKNKKNSLKVNRRSFQVPAHVIPFLESFKSENRISNFALFMAALAIYFHRFMNQDDFVIGMPVHNRSKKIFKEVVGMFVSTLPLRIRFEKTWTFHELIAYLKKELWESLKHQSYPYNHLVKDLKDANIDSSGLLNVQLIELPEAGHADIHKRAFFSTAYNISQLSVYLNQPTGKDSRELEIAVDYHADVFDEREIDTFFNRLFIILEQAIQAPDQTIAALSLLDEREYQELVHELNHTYAWFPHDNTLHRLFEEQVAKNPLNIALVCENQSLSYEKLNALSNKLAFKLHWAGVVPGSIVGMIVERSIEAVICILGILKAGGAYLPIDPEYPADRRNYIIQNSGIPILLIGKNLETKIGDCRSDALNVIPIDYETLEQEPAPMDFKEPTVHSRNLAYVIYTSGTTGNPKGTLLRHKNAINYIWWGAKMYVNGETFTFPLFSSLSFDLTVTSIFIPLITGNKIIIYRESKDELLIEKVFKDNRVDIIKVTPSHLKVINQLMAQSKGHASRIKTFIVGGEELKTEVAREIDANFGGNIHIYNEYGPTETAVGCMIHRYDRHSDLGLSVPIGKPADNVQIYILDPNRKILPLGIVGEIYISGDGVSAGYLKNDALTAERFVDNPFIPGKKMYKTGDLGRWNLDKILEFYGRCDEQVKIRGYRIEPAEIEKHLTRIPEIKDAVIAVHKGEPAELVAYVVSADSHELEVARLRESLGRELPDFMIPSRFVQVDGIPLTRHHKVDFRKLETMGKRLETAHEYTPPRNEIETLLSEIWSGVLGAERVGITDNFFELGGDSIKAVQIAARLNDAGKTVNVKDILSHQTIANLSANVDFDSHIRKYDQGTLEGDILPSPIEQWFLAQHFPNPHHYHQSVLLTFKNPVNVPVLEQAFDRLIAHHDGLRLNYNRAKNVFYFNNELLNTPFKIEVENLCGVPHDQWGPQIQTRGYEHKGKFNIEKGPMVRAVLFKTGAADQVLVILHHLVSDGITLRLLLEHLHPLYEALQAKTPFELPQKTASLRDWQDALIMVRDSGKLDQEKDYWQSVDAAECRIPYDHDPSTVDWRISNRDAVTVALSHEDTGFLLKDAHEVYKTDVQILVAAALVRTLRHWIDRRTVKIEMENHGRHIADLDTSKTTGWFTAIYPLLINRDDPTLGDEIKTVKEAIRHVPNHGLGYGILNFMTETGTCGEPQRAELRFNYLGQFDREIQNASFSYSAQSTGSDIALENPMTAAIEINAMVLNGVYQADIAYNRQAHTSETIRTLGDNYIRNLKTILDHIKNEDDVHFTPSDFDTVQLSEDDLANLFE
ncbi:MAG: amino acid adenylation domain-containing protein [Candidatus Omnitrophota bacterium]